MPLDKSQSEDKWNILFIVIPAMSLPIIFTQFFTSVHPLLLSTIGGGIGVGIGTTLYLFLRDSSSVTRKIALFLFVSISALFIYLGTVKGGFQEKLNEKWIKQKFGSIQFEAPYELKHLDISIPDSIIALYESIDFYAHKDINKHMSFTVAVLPTDTIPIEHSFFGALEGMLDNANIDLETVEIEKTINLSFEISTNFSFQYKKSRLQGYGFAYKNGKESNQIWLFPIKESFSEEFIKRFGNSIKVDYESEE